AEVRAGHGDRELPAEKLTAERVRVGERRQRLLAVVAVRRLPRGGDETLAVLARRLGDELLRPQPEVAVGLGDADLVAAVLPAGAEAPSELVARVAVAAPAELRHAVGVRQQAGDVDTHQRSGHDAERRERRVAAADRGLAREHMPEAALCSEPLELGARVGDRDELRAPAAAPLPEVIRVRPGLERRAGLRGGDEDRPPELDPLFERADRARMRRVEDVEALDAERPAKHLRGETRPAHAEQDDRVDVLVGERVGEALELTDPLCHEARLVEPTEPLRLVPSRPDGRIALPDSVDELLASRYDHYAIVSDRCLEPTPASSSANESANFCTPSSSSVSVTSS